MYSILYLHAEIKIYIYIYIFIYLLNPSSRLDHKLDRINPSKVNCLA